MKILFINLPYYGHVVPTIGLVQEQFFFLGKHLAEKYQKPVVRIFTAPVTNKKLMNQFISAKGPLSIFKCKWINKAFTKDIAEDIILKTDNWLDEIIYNPPELNLVYTLRAYQPYEKDFSEELYKFLGPSIYERKETSFDFVKGTKPVIYISLGTILKGAVSFFKMCIDVFGEENVDVIISVGQKFDMKKLKNIPTNIHIYKSVPQITVLKMADVFVTHGGMNSVSEALAYGVPMVVIPFVSDQPVNAEFVEKLGVGKRLEYSSVNRNLLRTTVLSMIENQEIKNNLEKVQEMINDAPGNRGGADMIINYWRNKG